MSDNRTALEKLPSDLDASLAQTAAPQSLNYIEKYGYGYDEDDTGSPLEILKWWRTIVNHKWLVIIIALIGTAATSLEMYRTRDTYQASAVIEIGKENSSLARTGEWIAQDDEDPIARTSLKTKMFILKSTPLLEDVIVNLKLDQNPRFLSDLDLESFKYKKKSLPEAIESISDRVFGQKEDAVSAEYKITPQPPTRVDLSSEESERLEPLVNTIRNYLAVEQVPDTRLLKISFTHTDPAIAEAIANHATQSLIKRSFEGKTEKLIKASDWLDQTTQELKAKVQRAEEALAKYTQEHNIFASPTKTPLIIEKLTRLHGEVMRAEADSLLKRSLLLEVKEGRVLQVPEAFADPKTAELQKRLGELTAKAAQLDVNYGSENPQVLEVHQQIEAVEKQLQANRAMLEEKFMADYDRALRDEKEFKAAFEQARVEAVQENQAAIQYNILQQEVETAKSLYKDFLQKTNQTNFELAREYNNLRVVEPARQPKVTVGPQRKQWMLLGFLLSLALGAGLAVLIDLFDKSIKTLDDVSRYVQLPALAVIPAVGTSSRRMLWMRRARKLPPLNVSDDSAAPLQIAEGTSSAYYNDQPAAEAYRLLRTSVVLSIESGASKTILITSSQPGEGKTTTTINTAISMAQFGASVLVIDCDLRTPRAHEALNAPQEPGLTTYLSSQADIDSLIQKLRIPGLSFLASGPVPSTPAELLSSEKMKELLDILAQRYDYILIDSPPMINLADTIILSTLVDGVLLVVQGGKSNRDLVRRVRQELSNVGANILGVVLNNVNPRFVGYSSYNS